MIKEASVTIPSFVRSFPLGFPLGWFGIGTIKELTRIPEQDDNQSIHNGVINETIQSKTAMRGTGKPSAGRKRSTKPKRED